MNDTVRLGRLMGVPVGLNWSLAVIVGIFAFGLAANRFPVDAPGYGPAAYDIAGAATAVALLGAILLHELGHAVVARSFGLEVEGITLSWMGGVTRIVGDTASPSRELSVAAIGPAISLVIGGLVGGVAALASAAGAASLVVSALAWLALINVVLALFNLVPASPLDGGRILHAAVWGATRSRWRATKVASGAGILLAGAVIALGAFDLLSGGAQLNGVFILILGWWLLNATRSEEQLATIHHILEGMPVHDVMRPVGAAPGWLTAEDFLARYVAQHPSWVWLLESWQGGYSGVVSGEALAAAPLPRGTFRPADVAVPVAAVAGASPDEEVLAALERTGGSQVLLVVEGGRTVGAVLPSDVDAIVKRGRDALRSRALPAGRAGR